MLGVLSGRVGYEANNRLCNISEIYSPSKYISGNLCLSQRVSALFSTQTPTTSLTGSLRSSLQNQTFELWFRDTTPSATISTSPQVLLENLDGRNTMVQIAIVAVGAESR